MRETALAMVAGMLIAYTAILIWALPHMASRYTPKLNTLFLRRVAGIPLALLLILLLVTGLLILRPLPHLLLAFVTGGRLQSLPWAGDALSFASLTFSVVLVLYSGYTMAHLFANDVQILSWLQDYAGRQEALQEILFNAVQRSDRQLAVGAIKEALADQRVERVHFVNWLMDHLDLLSTDWLTGEFLDVLLASDLDEDATKLYANLICLLLKKALDDEIFTRAKIIMTLILDALTRPFAWTKTHADLLYQMGFLLWNIGEEGAYAPRSARIPRQLTKAQEIFIQGMHTLWTQVQKSGDMNGVEVFAECLNQLTVKTLNMDLLMHAVTEYRFRNGLLTIQQIQAISTSLREIMREVMVDSCQEGVRNQVREQICHLFLDLGVMLVELGEEQEEIRLFLTNTRTGNVSALIRNALMNHQYQHDWIKQESYQAIAPLIGIPNFQMKY